MTSAGRHAGNALALLASGVGSKVVGFVTAALLFKSMPVADNGQFWLAMGLAFVVSILSELGLRGYLVRELARVRDDTAAARQCFGEIMNARLALAALVAPAAFVVLGTVYRDALTLQLTAWLFLYCLLDSLSLLLKSALRAYDRMGLDALFSFAGRVALLALVAYFASSGELSLREVVGAHVAAAVLELALVSAAVAAVLPLPLVARSTAAGLWRALSAAAPFAVVNVVGVLYMRTGIIALSRLSDDAAVAQFGAATRIPEALLFAPIALVNAVIPHLSRIHKDTGRVAKYYDFLFRYLGSAAVAIGAVFLFAPRSLVLAIATPEYLAAAPAFQWLGIWLVLAFLHHATANMLIVLNHEKWVMQRYLMAFGLCILFNVMLAPGRGATGAAMALCLSEGAGLALDTIRLGRLGVRASAKSAGFIALAAGLAALVLGIPWHTSEWMRIGAAGVAVAIAGAFVAALWDRDAIGLVRGGSHPAAAGTLPPPPPE